MHEYLNGLPVALRSSETLDALADCMIAMLATVPRMDVPSELRQMAKRARREVAQARAEGVADMVGGRS